MIRNFEKVDARRISVNSFSQVGDMSFVFDDPSFYKSTLVGEDSGIYAIICFKRYWENCFLGFFLVSKDIKPIHARELKRFINQVLIDFEVDRMQTDSVACEMMTRWHKFLRFKSEGIREKMIYGKDYEMWAMLKGRDF